MDSTTITPFNSISDTLTGNSTSSMTYTFVTYSLIVFLVLILFYMFRSILVYNTQTPENFGNASNGLTSVVQSGMNLINNITKRN
jgi:hypothetical protein